MSEQAEFQRKYKEQAYNKLLSKKGSMQVNNNKQNSEVYEKGPPNI